MALFFTTKVRKSAAAPGPERPMEGKMNENRSLAGVGWSDKYWKDARERVEAATDKDGRIWVLTTLFTIDTVVGLYTFLILVLKFRIRDITGFRLVFDEADIPVDGGKEGGEPVIALEFDALVGSRYRDRGIGSATEACLIDFAKIVPDLGVEVSEDGKQVTACAIPGMMSILKMLRQNNETGYLKGRDYPWSFAWLLRKVEYLHQPENCSFEEHHGSWLERMTTVIHHVLGTIGSGQAPDVDGFKARFPDIARDLGVGKKLLGGEEYLLTMPGYLATLHPDDVGEEYAFFRAAFEETKRVRDGAEAEAERLFAEISSGKGPHRSHEAPWGGQILVVHTDDQNATGFLFGKLKRVSVIVARTSRGHASFMPKDGAGVILDDVAEHVSAREPDRWRYMRFGEKWLLLNGGSKVRFLVKPTKFTDEELADLAARLVSLTERGRDRLASELHRSLERPLAVASLPPGARRT